jgi:hypothetical protein
VARAPWPEGSGTGGDNPASRSTGGSPAGRDPSSRRPDGPVARAAPRPACPESRRRNENTGGGGPAADLSERSCAGPAAPGQGASRAVAGPCCCPPPPPGGREAERGAAPRPRPAPETPGESVGSPNNDNSSSGSSGVRMVSGSGTSSAANVAGAASAATARRNGRTSARQAIDGRSSAFTPTAFPEASAGGAAPGRGSDH